MGMIGNYLRVSETELGEYIADSSKLEDRIYSDDSPEDENLIDIDKAWEGIFFLLTGKSINNAEEADAPLCWVLSGPKEVDPEQELGYGPATYITSEQTRDLHISLKEISIEDLKARYNGKLMMELDIYPQAWEEKEGLDYLLEYFKALKEFYNKAASGNQAVIMFVN